MVKSSQTIGSRDALQKTSVFHPCESVAKNSALARRQASLLFPVTAAGFADGGGVEFAVFVQFQSHAWRDFAAGQFLAFRDEIMQHIGLRVVMKFAFLFRFHSKRAHPH